MSRWSGSFAAADVGGVVYVLGRNGGGWVFGIVVFFSKDEFALWFILRATSEQDCGEVFCGQC